MAALRDRIEQLMRSIDEKVETFSEASIPDALRAIRDENLEAEDDDRFVQQAEEMAFGFYPNNSHGWATYYGPMIVSKDENGQWFEAPSIQLVTPEMISYWMRRAESATHPLLRIRYADLVWDFTQKVTNSRPDIKAALIVIDSTLEFIRNKCYDTEISAIEKLERGLSIALSIRDVNRIEAVKSTILMLEAEIADDIKPGLWGFSFDNLLLNKKVPLSDEEKKKILGDLESRLSRLVASIKDNNAIHAVEAAARRLAHYYQVRGQIEDMRRVLRAYGKAVIATANATGAIAGLAHLQQLYNIYYNFGMREDADKLTEMISKMGKRAEEEMHEISYTINIPTEQIEQYMEALTRGSLEEVLVQIAAEFIPDSEQTTHHVRDLAAKAPLSFLITRSILDSSGRPIAQIGSIEEDLDGHVVLQLTQNMNIAAVFLREAIKRTRDRFSLSLETLLDYIYKSPVFQAEYKSLVAQGLEAYLSDDHVSAAHILIPQIENALRCLLQMSGEFIYKPNRVGGFAFRILDDILRDESVVKVLGGKVTKYLQVLLVDQRGWNVRNYLCHGMLLPQQINSTLTDRLFHVLLLLALLRGKAPENA